jgi:putative flippase GtrA
MTAVNGKSVPKIVRFVVVGVINTIFGFLVFAGLTLLGCPDVLAVPAAMAVGVIFNFVSYGGLVFASLDTRRLPRFIAAYLCLFACNVFGLRVLARFGLNAYSAQAVLVFPLAVLAYLLNDRWVFHGA